MYRPTPDELASLFAGQQILHKGGLVGDTYWSHVARRPLTIFFRHFFRFFVPFLGWKAWKRSMRKLYWLFHHYKVAAIVGQEDSVKGAGAGRLSGTTWQLPVPQPWLCLQVAAAQATSRDASAGTLRRGG